MSNIINSKSADSSLSSLTSHTLTQRHIKTVNLKAVRNKHNCTTASCKCAAYLPASSYTMCKGCKSC